MNRFAMRTFSLILVAAFAGCVGDPDTDDGVEPSLGSALGNPDTRIAIVGAGPSGLTAARTLAALGYENVTVFEKEADVGGKVNSPVILGNTVELGAVFASPDYELTLDLADEYAIPYVEYQTPRFILDEAGQARSFPAFLTSRYSNAQIGLAIQKYAAVLALFQPEIDGDGFAGMHPDLMLTFDKFAIKYEFVPIAELAKSIMVGFGYGYYEDVPAAYFMKLLPWLVKLGPGGIESPPYFTFPDGFQSLWRAVAADLDVRLSSTVTKIKRSTSGGPVEVTINYVDKRQFDVVIVSVPLNVVGKFLDLTSAEKALFNKVETSRYFVTLFGAVGLQTGRTLFLHDNARPQRINHASVFGNRGDGLPLFVAYQIVQDWMPSVLVTATLLADVFSIGNGAVAIPVTVREWEYFPHVGTRALEQGFYDQVEALQGQRGVYYVGGTMSFETVEHSARYARTLVESHFPATSFVTAP